MKKIVLLMFTITITFPFLNALFSAPSAEIRSYFTMNDDSKHRVFLSFDHMMFTGYHKLSNGSASVTRGIYGVLNDTYFTIFFSRRYSHLPKDPIETEKIKNKMRENFLYHGNPIAIMKVKKVGGTHIVRYYYPLANNDNYFYKDVEFLLKK